MEKFGIRDCNCASLRKAARRLTSFYDSQLQPSGLRATQFAILALVNEMEEVSVNLIAERLGLDRTTAGKNLRPLEQAGFIEVVSARHDARQRAISVTRAGHAALKTAVPLWRQAQSRFEAANGADKAAMLRETLKELVLDPR
ncbi:MAG: winged helix-turn-helix transcriptional regulator [Alphaproteobacteria bacterium]|nr:winged helix-turn-helix transcriptional regulator [Alphaproteobacteria bacterium]